jgi:hypothetical protein
MKIPVISGLIDRRILINYQVDPASIEKILPARFRPKLVQGKAVAGICLIRLRNIKPKFFPLNWGIDSENAAHRIAVEWEDDGILKEGVYIPRRDTSSKLNAFAGGRIFPGVHHHANFSVAEDDTTFKVSFESDDNTFLSIAAEASDGNWNAESVFENIACASDFFKNGSLGYSPDRSGRSFHGLELKTEDWKVSQLKVLNVRSSFFENPEVFPHGSVRFDNALLMKNLNHEWKGHAELHTAEG